MSLTHGREIQDLSTNLIKLACAKRLHIVTAESCTAGALATLLADTPGAGDCFAGGFVAYAKSCKRAVLEVAPELIAEHTAVSQEVTLAMARGALLKCPVAQLSIAVTCVGGPKPDEDGNPVGLTHVAVCGPCGLMQAADKFDLSSSDAIRTKVIESALTLAISFVRTVEAGENQPL